MLIANRQVLREGVDPRDAALVDEGGRLDPVLDAMLPHGHGVRTDDGQAVEGAQMLKIDSVRRGDPGIGGTRAAEMRLADQLALLRAGNTRHREGRGLAVERPDEAPRLRGGIGRDAGAGRDLVAGRDVHARARAVERPVMVGAADPSLDHLAHREIRAQVGAEGALHHRASARVPVEDHAGAEKILAENPAGLHVAGQGQGEPGPVKARRFVLPLPPLQGEGHVGLLGLTPYIYNVNTSRPIFG